MNLVVLTLMAVGQLYCEAPPSVVSRFELVAPFVIQGPTEAEAVYTGAPPVALEPPTWYYCPIHGRYTQWQKIQHYDGSVGFRLGASVPGSVYRASTPYRATTPYITITPGGYPGLAPSVGRQTQRYGLFGRRVITRTVTPAPRTYAPAYTYSRASTSWGNCAGGYCY